MRIQHMFHDDINRQINGVIKVDQKENEVIEQEVREYVITKELRKHFSAFFNYYSDSFDVPTADVGVWISGFFGSGKSHFLKMLSYILENRAIGNTSTVELFREKFEDDPATFMQIDRATRAETETILFNIDIEGFINKDKTAVLRVFAKMFYNHLGFYGENLKVAMMEYYIAQSGKTEEFKRVFQRIKGKNWEEMRRAFSFNKKAVVATLVEVLDMSEDDALAWFTDKTATELSIAQLVRDIKTYVASKPKNFRLLFMIDEVGQYVGTDTDMLLNLQSLTEKLGSECQGKVWVVCTGQEAIDEIIKVRADEFSRIQARFKTRLSLSSSSVDEVIQKRILKKKPEAQALLSNVYDRNDSVLRNLFTFNGAQLDIKGYSSHFDFTTNFPFVPYQFIIMQKVFAEIRKHGNAGKHLSGGERSMLSGFQEAAQHIQDRDENALIPFFRFYDTVHSFLDGSIRRVIDRCDRAATAGDGITPYDVDVLKLLYLIRYIDNDVPANLDNIVILMADDIRTDKIVLREKVRDSLNNLLGQNYIGRSGDTYNFLTDEEQDIQRAIRNETSVDTAAIVERIGNMIFADIYANKKYRRGEYNFPFDSMVDNTAIGAVTGGMKLRFLTFASDISQKSPLFLRTESNGQAIFVLGETDYYNSLEQAMKIRKYVKQRNVASLSKSVQDIIRNQQEEATRLEATAAEELRKAITSAQIYAAGELLVPKPGDAKAKIDHALDYLVSHIYRELELVTQNYSTDMEIIAILQGTEQVIPGMEPNRDAAAKMEEYLQMQQRKKLPTSMSDIQSRFQNIPYGWREIDIAAVAARLIADQKVTIKYSGNTIRANDAKLPDMLRKKSEIGKTIISIKESVSASKMKEAREFLRDYFDVMDVPADEEGLIGYILTHMVEQKEHYAALLRRYDSGRRYPDHDLIQKAYNLVGDVLSQQKDNIALIDRLLKLQDDLLDSKEHLVRVEGFFQNQVQIFDAAAQMEQDLRNEADRLAEEPDAYTALNQIRLMVNNTGRFDYKRIPLLTGWMNAVREGHGRLLRAKREELNGYCQQCMGAIHQTANGHPDTRSLIDQADKYFRGKYDEIAALQSLALLDGLLPPMLQYKDQMVSKIEAVMKPKPVEPDPKPVKRKNIRTYNRSIVFPARTLESEADVDAYVEQIRSQLKLYLDGCDGIKLN